MWKELKIIASMLCSWGRVAPVIYDDESSKAQSQLQTKAGMDDEEPKSGRAQIRMLRENEWCST